MVLLLPLLGLAAGVLTTLAGQGGGLVLLLACSALMGPHAALAITSPALLLGNAHRALLFRRYVDRPVALRLVAGAVPGAFAGGLLAGALPPRALEVLLVVLTAAAIAKALGWIRFGVPRAALAPAGVVVGGMTGTAGGAGMLVAPVLLAAGLSGPAFIGTSSAVGVAMHAGRVAAYGATGVLAPELLLPTSLVAAAILVGNALGERVRARLGARVTVKLEYGVLVACAALSIAGRGEELDRRGPSVRSSMRMTNPPDPRDVALKRVGQTLNHKWTIDRLLDVGGMAAVYAATHRNGKKVAIKMLLPHIATHEDVRERFLREGYVANQVDHPGAVSILDDDLTPDGAPFIVMELLEGESLDGWMARAGGKLPLPDVLAVADQVLDVLAAFHARHVIHRDIKPGNLFVTKTGIVKVLDFGLARLRDPRVPPGRPTGSGIVLGTAAYMPPEQAQGRTDQIDARTDVFAVGAVMFRALTGRPIFEAKSNTERLFQAMKERAPSLAAIVPDTPPWVVGVVDKALAFEKTERWASASDMRVAVRAAFVQLKEEAERVKLPPGATPIEHDASAEVSHIFDAILEPSIVVDVSFGGHEKLEKGDD